MKLAEQVLSKKIVTEAKDDMGYIAVGKDAIIVDPKKLKELVKVVQMSSSTSHGVMSIEKIKKNFKIKGKLPVQLAGDEAAIWVKG